jgi:hypothetical protein
MSAFFQKTFRAAGLATLLSLVFIQTCTAASTNQELHKLEQADQSDRASGSNKINWAVVGERDAVRRARAMEILKSGNVRSADDYLNAAIIFQHGDAVEDTELALALATTASRIDDTKKDAKILAAQAMDRILVKRGKPQWYGTQFFKNKSTGKWEMFPTDLTVVTDAQREAMGIPTITDTKSHLDAMNARQ